MRLLFASRVAGLQPLTLLSFPLFCVQSQATRSRALEFAAGGLGSVTTFLFSLYIHYMIQFIMSFPRVP